MEGYQIKSARESLGWSHHDLARRADVTFNQVWNLEHDFASVRHAESRLKVESALLCAIYSASPTPPLLNPNSNHTGGSGVDRTSINVTTAQRDALHEIKRSMRHKSIVQTVEHLIRCHQVQQKRKS